MRREVKESDSEEMYKKEDDLDLRLKNFRFEVR